MSDSESFGAGVLSVIFVLAIFVIAFILGWIVSAERTGSDCTNFGKTRIGGNWHECRPMTKASGS